MSRSGPSKQVKRYVSANKKEIDDIRSGLGTVMAEIGKLRSEVQGGDDKDANDLLTSPPTIVSSGTATAEPVYVRNGWSRTVEMTPYGVAIIHEEQHVNDDMLLDPTTPAPSPTPTSPVPVRSTKMGFLERTAICGILATSAVGIGAIGVVGAFCIGAIDESHLLSGLEWAQEWRAQVASGGVTFPVILAWLSRIVPATYARAAMIWAAVRRLEEMGQTLAK